MRTNVHLEGGKESLLDAINDDGIWEALINRRESINPDDPDVDLFRRMMGNEACRSVCEEISKGIHVFSIPEKKLIPKGNSRKMRAVYQLDRYEMVAMKIIADQLYQYDWLFSDNLYSFRRNVYVGSAIRKLFETKGLEHMWGYKADVHNYFNSIPVGPLLERLDRDLSDSKLFEMFKSILMNDTVRFRGEEVREAKGVMAGVPVSAFLANYYLKDVDELFGSLDCVYMRYADDILILSESQEKMMELRADLIRKVEEAGLEMNPDKEHFFEPGEPFEFLGFKISGDAIDISSNTIRKMKGKIRRSAKSIRRWMLDKDAPVEGTIRALIRKYNSLFYGYENGELSWAAWYFSTITTSDSLHEIDLHFQEWLRYIATGRHNHKNRAIVTYDTLRSCGYRPLVAEYYSSR